MKITAALILASGLLFSCNSIDSNRLDDLAEAYMTENHVPGMVCAVVKNGDISWGKSYGKANLEKSVAMSREGYMNVASVTKTITATAIMQLWEQGEIDLDQDINHYLAVDIKSPYFPDVPITVKLLLTHTSSLVDGSAYYESYACGDPEISLQEWIVNYLLQGGRFFNEDENFLPVKPGEQYQYSNIGFGLLGYIVESVSGLSFSEYCSLNIFDPLEMTGSSFYLQDMDLSNHILPYVYISKESRDEIVNNYATFLSEDADFSPGKNKALCLYSFPNIPDGLLRTSVEELSHFLSAYMNGGQYNGSSILKQSTIDKMLSLQLEGDGSQGLCWHRSEFESLWGHGGNDPGLRTSMFFSRDTKIGIIIFQNSDQGNPFELLEKIYRLEKQN